MGQTSLMILGLALALTSCSHYRGIGPYRTSSDYRFESEAPSRGPNAIAFLPKRPFQISWPVRQVRINRGFKPSSDRRHEGIDLGGRHETPILAAHEGLVIYTGRDFRGYGNMVLVEYSPEWATLYAHLNSITVRPGQVVEAGDPLGGMGRTGQATGVHLHFELLHKRKPIDPLPYLSRRPRFAGL